MASSPASKARAVARTQAKKRAYIWYVKSLRGCRVCGEADPVVLEMNHIDPSTKIRNNKNTLSWDRLSWAQIEVEIEKCEVLCANCHRRETYKGREPKVSFLEYVDGRGKWSRR